MAAFWDVALIKWLGHVQRMGTSRIAKRILESKTNGELSTGKTEVVGWSVWRPKGAESEKLQGISNVQESLEWESRNAQRVVMLMEEKTRCSAL
jgi:hypothetical protein